MPVDPNSLKFLGAFLAGIIASMVATVFGKKSNNPTSNTSAVASSTPDSVAVARPSIVQSSDTRKLTDVEPSDEMTGALYYPAFVGTDDYLYRSTQGMNHFETLLYLGYVRENGTTFTQTHDVWGVYTDQQVDAKLLAVEFGYFNKQEVHGINYFGHYHDGWHVFHIFYGNPIP